MEAAPEIEKTGAKLVVGTPQSAERAAAWRDELDLGQALVVADPKRTLYRALGAHRPRPTWILRPRVLVAGLRAVLGGERVSVTKGDDTLLLGIDLVVEPDGRIAFIHRAKDAADRTPPEELIRRALETTPPG